MLRLERKCTCQEQDQEECAACAEWWELNTILSRELQLKPWQIRSYEHPEDAEPLTPGQADFGGPVARYRMLKQALKGAGRDRA